MDIRELRVEQMKKAHQITAQQVELKWIKFMADYCNSEDKELNREEAHSALKNLLLEIGYTNIVKEYEEIIRKQD